MNNFILHLDMDAFFASIEQAVNPRFKGKPVIVGGRPDRQRTVVCSASYEAKKFGIESGMSSWMAYKLCPKAIFIPADTAKYLHTSHCISELLKSYSEKLEQSSIDEFYLDVSGSDVIFIKEISHRIKETIKQSFDITASIGIAPNKMLAKLASKLSKPDGLLIIKKENAPLILHNLPVEKIAGIGLKTKQRLNGLGIYTCGQLMGLPNDLLVRYFGILGNWLYNVCRGEDDSVVSSSDGLTQKSIGHSITVSKDVYSQEVISGYLLMLSEMVGTRLRKDNLSAQVIQLTIRYKDLSTFSRQKTLSDYMYSTESIYKNVLYLFSYIKLKAPVRLLGVGLSGLIVNPQQGLLFECDKKNILLNRAVDSINERFGDSTVTYAKILLLN
ncbi:MAG: DNA polymerase IV [Candidatus Omnitrophota bacterium]